MTGLTNRLMEAMLKSFSYRFCHSTSTSYYCFLPRLTKNQFPTTIDATAVSLRWMLSILLAKFSLHSNLKLEFGKPTTIMHLLLCCEWHHFGRWLITEMDTHTGRDSCIQHLVKNLLSFYICDRKLHVSIAVNLGNIFCYWQKS
jgi:hypothetical protein